MRRTPSQASQAKTAPTSRRSSINYTNYCTDLVFSPSKPPLTEARLKSTNLKAAEIASRMSEKKADLALSELVMLHKSGSPNGVANIRVSDFNFLINHVISLVSQMKEMAPGSAKAEESQPPVTALPGKVESELCDIRFEIRNLKESMINLQSKISRFEKTLEKDKSTLELAFQERSEDLEMTCQMTALENLMRIGKIETQFENLLSASQSSSQASSEPTQTAEAVDDSGDEVIVLDISQVLGELETESQLNEELFGVHQSTAEADVTASRFENWADGHSLEIARDILDMVIATAIPEQPRKMSRVVKQVRFSTSDTASQTDEVDKADNVRPQPQEAAVDDRARVGVFELLKPGEYPEEELAMKKDNHFSIIMTGCKIPATVRKISTIRKLERKFATEMTQSLYPQFHESCIKYIKSLRPLDQPRSVPYDIKVVYGSEHVRQHVLGAACHAQLLVRPFISGKQLEQLQEEQVERYSIQGTSQPGPAFLACGGAASLKRMHPSTEASMKAWDKEYQRRKRFNREIVVGGRHAPNMRSVVVDTPVRLDTRSWNNQLQKAYSKYVMTRNVQEFFSGARLQPPNSYQNMGVAETARTATSGSSGPMTPSSMQMPTWANHPRK